MIVQNSSWVWIFYGSAALTFMWAALWAVFFFDMPEDDPFITGGGLDNIWEMSYFCDIYHQ